MREELEPVAAEALGDTELSHVEWGTMIELPRAAVTAAEIADAADFFSFGTNDLTQTAFGFSRDDIGKFVAMYEERKLVPTNPFVTIDQEGVGRLMRMATDEGRAANEVAAPRDLRRARRRPGERRVLPRDRARLRELLAVPGGDGAPWRPARRPWAPRSPPRSRDRVDLPLAERHLGVRLRSGGREAQGPTSRAAWDQEREHLSRIRWQEQHRAERSFACGIALVPETEGELPRPTVRPPPGPATTGGIGRNDPGADATADACLAPTGRGRAADAARPGDRGGTTRRPRVPAGGRDRRRRGGGTGSEDGDRGDRRRGYEWGSTCRSPCARRSSHRNWCSPS